MKGPIEIAAIANLGGLGEKEGPRLIYDWKPCHFLPPLGPWVFFIILFLIAFVKDRSTGAILLPVLILQIIILVFGRVTGLAAYINLFTALCLAMATILLQPIKIKYKKPYSHLLQAFGIMILYAFLMLYSYKPVGPESQSRLFLDYGAISLIIILAVIISARICKKHNNSIQQLSVWLLVLIIAFTGIVPFLYSFIEILNQGFTLITIPGIIGILFMAILLGIGIYLFILPFIILSIKNSYYKSQLMKMLDLSEKKSPIPAIFMPRNEKEKQSDESRM